MEKELSNMSANEVIQLYTEQDGWIETSKQRPKIDDNVEYSDDGITVEGTMNYTNERHCMLAYSSNFGHNFGEGFATDGYNGCDKGLKCDDPKYWRPI